MSAVECELAHGYTLAQIHQLTRLAVHTAGSMAGDWHERYETAWMGVVEALYSAPHWPDRYHLVQAGQLAIYAAVDEHQQAYGYYRRKTDGAAHGMASSPAFRIYWWDLLTPLAHPSPETRVVERTALAQIWPRLRPYQQQALAALAAHDNDYRAAEQALGWSAGRLSAAVSEGRRAYLAWWHQGERPSRQWRMAGRRRLADAAGLGKAGCAS